MKSITTLALIVSTLPMAAFAGGMAQPVVEPMIVAPVAPVVYAPSVDWTGAYAGASLGFGNFTASGAANDGHEGIAGLQLGYRKDFGSLVVGGELSYSKNDIGSQGNDNQINTAKAAKLMIGADMGRTLVYATAGLAMASANIEGNSATDNGYLGGIGMDYMLNDKWTVGGEVLTSKYDNFSNSGIDLEDTTLQVKVGYKF